MKEETSADRIFDVWVQKKKQYLHCLGLLTVVGGDACIYCSPVRPWHDG